MGLAGARLLPAPTGSVVHDATDPTEQDGLHTQGRQLAPCAVMS